MSVGLTVCWGQDDAGRCSSSKPCSTLIKRNIFSSGFLKLLSVMEEMSLKRGKWELFCILCVAY